MKKVIYICDACKQQIDNPHQSKMKEFRMSFDHGGFSFFKIFKKIHLCDKCFGGLKHVRKETSGV